MADLLICKTRRGTQAYVIAETQMGRLFIIEKMDACPITSQPLTVTIGIDTVDDFIAEIEKEEDLTYELNG